jgi:hypothetical protein
MLLPETQIWGRLSHENVVQFYGASLATDARSLSLGT